MKRDPATFSVRLREATQSAHTAAETSSFITDLMEGRLTCADYVRLIAQYRPIYAALELGAAKMREDAHMADILDARLDRLSLIEDDLAGLVDWAGMDALPEAVPASGEYAARIEDVCRRGDRARLLAHHYLRYLGDLSGGQAIAARARRHYGVPRELLSMWRFEGVDRPQTYKDRYRDRLDELGPILGEDDIVDEASRGFRHNQALFAELRPDFAPA